MISAVPTNIITGFLGVGKSTAIMHLLSSKPADERWAVLVNEFGEVGIDGGLISGANANNEVYIREVPGGCMCCAAGLPMQIALAQLLAKAKPQRLLIEPTGLGHPKEVLGVLSADYNQETIALNKIITLVDARKISDARYHQHYVFRQQLEIADIVVANKYDQYDQSELSNLQTYLATQLGKPDVEIRTTSFGKIDLALLAGATKRISNYTPQHHNESRDHENSHNSPLRLTPKNAGMEFSDAGFICKENHGEGFMSVGWQFSPEYAFSFDKIKALLAKIAAERVKGVFICDRGIYAINIADSTMIVKELDETTDSRVEIITADQINKEELQAALLNCLANTD